MANERMKEDWRLVQERIQNIWEDIDFTEDDMKRGRADLNEMVSVIEEKTDEDRTKILQKLEAVIF